MQSEIKKEIIKLCGTVNEISPGNWHFVYNHIHYLFMSDEEGTFLRFAVPHIAKSEECDTDLVSRAINETNREVKFVKAVILENGSVSISYDHKLTADDNTRKIVPHIIKSLHFASDYLKKKIKKNTH